MTIAKAIPQIEWPNHVYHPKHGPQRWPWWRLFSVSIVRLSICEPSFGYACWLYTRWGALCLDLMWDRRAK